MSIVDEVRSLDMKVDEKFLQPSLIEALDVYHALIEKNIIKPRENQLNKSGVMPQTVHFNVKKSDGEL